MPNTTWLNYLQLGDEGVELRGEGEADSAAPLLGLLSEAKGLTNAAFSTSLVKTPEGERFQITAERKTGPQAVQAAGAGEPGPETPRAAEPAAAAAATLGTLEATGEVVPEGGR
jgi:hypothetical protein